MDTETDGFTRFYETARDDCLRAVYASVGDPQAAEDLVAEAFSRAWARWRTVSRHPAPQAWVVRTARNARVSWWRRRRREIAFPEPAAETLGIAPGTVTAHLARAIATLRAELSPTIHEESWR